MILCERTLPTTDRSVFPHNSLQARKSKHSAHPIAICVKGGIIDEEGFQKAEKKRKGGLKDIVKPKKRSATNELYNINNMVSTEIGHRGKIQTGSEREQVIAVPEVRLLDEAYYCMESIEIEKEIEDDSSELYEKLHKDYELAEVCSKYSAEGEVMPSAHKGNLKIRIQLPTLSNKHPVLLC